MLHNHNTQFLSLPNEYIHNNHNNFAMNIIEKDNNFEIIIQCNEIKKEDLKISIEGNDLIIKNAEKRYKSTKQHFSCVKRFAP